VTRRPTVSVIVPFAGSEPDLDRVLGVLNRLVLRAGDELIVADNRTSVGRAVARGKVRVLPAGGVRSPAFARNAGARIAHGQWLVFLDADTEPTETLLDDYFGPSPDETTAIIAGEIADVARRPTTAARHSAGRRQMSQLTTIDRACAPYAQTANCAVLRSAFEAVGGFEDRVRAGEDADLCIRLARAGWRLEYRPQATVSHRSRETLAGLLGQLARHGSGAAWLNRRYPGSFPPPRPRELAARTVGSIRRALAAVGRREPEAVAFALIELAEMCAFELGRLLPNRALREVA
jgi:mycofactocin glycosyltransferase